MWGIILSCHKTRHVVFGLLLSALLSLMPAWVLAVDIQVKGLFGNSALLIIDGKQKLLKAGKEYNGVKLISANSKMALVEINGKRHKLSMTRRISSSFKAAESVEVRLPKGHGGHYIAQGRINNRSAEMMVDTGATSIAMSSIAANALGIDYRNARTINVSTASGMTQGYVVKLHRVSVGAVTVNNVEAIINEGAFPQIILLGNSFLSRVSMSEQNGVLVLTSKLN